MSFNLLVLFLIKIVNINTINLFHINIYWLISQLCGDPVFFSSPELSNCTFNFFLLPQFWHGKKRFNKEGQPVFNFYSRKSHRIFSTAKREKWGILAFILKAPFGNSYISVLLLWILCIIVKSSSRENQVTSPDHDRAFSDLTYEQAGI